MHLGPYGPKYVILSCFARMDILNTCANFRENDSILFLMVGIIAISLSGIIKTLETAYYIYLRSQLTNSCSSQSVKVALIPITQCLCFVCFVYMVCNLFFVMNMVLPPSHHKFYGFEGVFVFSQKGHSRVLTSICDINYSMTC